MPKTTGISGVFYSVSLLLKLGSGSAIALERKLIGYHWNFYESNGCTMHTNTQVERTVDGLLT